MGKIITLKDNITQETAYPITKIEAIITEDGSKFSDVLEQRILEVDLLLKNAILQAQAAEDSIKNLNRLSDTTTTQQTLMTLVDQIE